jgi:hypothetical protein
MVRLVARGGELFEVASQNYRSGLNPKENSEDANIVCILHDDGMFSLYAHLSWNSIRGLTGGASTRWSVHRRFWQYRLFQRAAFALLGTKKCWS